MPANNGLRGDKDQRFLPARANLSQNDPEPPVDGTQSRARSLCVQSQQLLPKGEVLQEEFFSGAKDGEDPAEQMSKAHKHQGIIAKSAPGRCSSKSLILRSCRVLASYGLGRYRHLAPRRGHGGIDRHRRPRDSSVLPRCRDLAHIHVSADLTLKGNEPSACGVHLSLFNLIAGSRQQQGVARSF
jgi:hypothetical protein